MYLINQYTFVDIPNKEEIYRIIKESGVLAPRNKEFEEIFYASFDKQIHLWAWLDYLYSPKIKRNMFAPEILRTFGLVHTNQFLELLEIERQRQCEMYYVGIILTHIAQDDHNFGLIPVEVFSGLMKKYNLKFRKSPGAPKRKYTKRTFRVPIVEEPSPVLIPDPDPIVETQLIKIQKERTKRTMTRDNPEATEIVRKALIRCEPVKKISKTLGFASSTPVSNIMRDNMFVLPNDTKTASKKTVQSLSIHIANVKRAIAAGRTFGYYVQFYAICERALFKALYLSDPEYCISQNITPSCDSIIFEFKANGNSMSKTAEAFGVSIGTMKRWINTCTGDDAIFSPGGVRIPKTMLVRKEEDERKRHMFFSESDTELMDSLKKLKKK